jgi:aminomethyltransferase
MILRPDEPNQGRLFMVANAATKDADFAHIETLLGSALRVMPLLDHALLALQGPKAASVLERCIKGTSNLAFMQAREFDVDGQTSLISRSGYTGEDGFEISVPSDHAESLARQLLNQDEVAFAGLGARDSLRLEAGLCLYGHDLTEDINPVEADLRWMIGKHRREEGGFPGARHILELLQHGSDRIRIGIVPEGRAPAREGALIQDQQGRDIGLVTSGTFGPTYGGPIAMGYVDRAFSEVGTELQLVIRGTPCPACVTSLPFVPHRYHRKG